MKICLVAASAAEMAPYLQKYEQLCRAAGVEYDIISKRHESDRKAPAENEKIFYYRDAKTPFGRWRRFAAFASFAGRVLRTGSYDGAVIFTGMNGAFLTLKCRRVLRKMRYIADIRDIDKSMSALFLSHCFRTFVRKAQTVVLSSPKFAEWVPKAKDIAIMHNLPNAVAATHTAAFTHGDITVGYLGKIDYLPQNIALVNAVRDYAQIRLVYRGIYPRGRHIRNYCLETGVKNAFFYGTFDNAQKETLYRDVDIINAIYGNDSPVVTTALPNKLYDAAVYKIPIMVSAGTYLAEIVTTRGLGFAISPETDDILGAIRTYAQQFDAAAFESACDAFLKEVRAEQSCTVAKLNVFFGSGI